MLEARTLDVQSELARRSFRRFVVAMRPHYALEVYHLRIVREIQAWADAPQPYVLILSMPPGHAKSEYAKLCMAWLVTRDRSTQAVYASYGQDLADQQLRDVQAILDSEEYLALYPPALNARRAVTDDSRGAKRTGDYAELLSTPSDAAGGWVKSIGRGGGLTGYRLDVGLVDDLLKDASEASSPSTREAAWLWLTRVLLTRKRAGRALRLLVLATRWHLDDPTGRLLAQMGDRCRELRLEALREDLTDADDPRELGEALWPAVATAGELADQRALDPAGFASLYQQQPTPSGGRLVEASWLPLYHDTPWLVDGRERPGRWLQSWDLRGGGRQDAGSYAVGILAYVPHDAPARCYIVDVARSRWSPEETLRTYLRLSLDDPLWSRAVERLVEAAADGKMVIAQAAARAPAIAIRACASKHDRARAAQPHLRAAQVELRAGSSWLPDLMHELVTFPGAPNDDQMDALTQLIAHLWARVASDRQAEVHQRRTGRARDLGRY